MRVVGVVRLSRESETGTSPERQREAIARWAEINGHEIVGWAEDIGVSASVAPAERPGLGAWLTGKRGQFDALVCWRLDRIARRVLHLAQLIDRARLEGWTIVSTSESFDLGTPFGRIVASIIGALAEGELEAIRERVRQSREHLVRIGRYPGRTPVPLGYRVAPNPAGAGKVLVPDDGGSRVVVEEIVRRVLDGEPPTRIAVDLTRRGVPTARGWARIHRGQPPGEEAWTPHTIIRLLRGQSLLGYAEPPIYDDAGRRVRRSEPLITRATWHKLQAALDARRPSKMERARPRSPWLAGVLICEVCGRNYQTASSGRDGVRLRCGSMAARGREWCGNGSVRLSEVEGEVERRVLAELGNIEIVEPVYVAGESHREEIEATEQALGRLVARLEQIEPGGAGEAAILARIREHEKHLEALRALPETEPSIEFEPTGETWGEVWQRSDADGRRALLKRTGVRVYIRKAPRSKEAPELRLVIGPTEGEEPPPIGDTERWRVVAAREVEPSR